MFMSRIVLAQDFGRYIPNAYQMHRRLSMAFPLRQDRDFSLEQFLPTGFDVSAQVNVRRDHVNGFLFCTHSNVVIVQSGSEPNWTHAFENSEFILSGDKKIQVRPLSHEYEKGERLRFGLKCSPTRQQAKVLVVAGEEKRKLRRVPISNDGLDHWLKQRGEFGGFRVDSVSIKVHGVQSLRKQLYADPDDSEAGHMRHFAVTYQGTLTVTDPNRFEASIVAGIGPGKGMGFGLMLVQKESPL